MFCRTKYNLNIDYEGKNMAISVKEKNNKYNNYNKWLAERR